MVLGRWHGVIRRTITRLARPFRHDRAGEAIADSYRRHPQTREDDELAMSSAIALTESEPMADPTVESAGMSDDEATSLALEAQGWARDHRE